MVKVDKLRAAIQIAAIFCLTSCAPAAIDDGHVEVTDFNDQSDRNGGKIVFGISWEPVSFNPLRALDSASYYAQTLVYEGLLRYDKNLQIVPALAASYEVSADGRTYRFKLRPEAKFSDGKSVTIADIQASFKAAASDASPFKTDYKCIEKIDYDEAKGEVSLHLAYASAPLLSRIVEMRILPARIWNLPDHGIATLSRNPVASGPFRLVRWESGLELVFEPNPFYWGEKPKMSELVWRVVPDKTLLGISLNRGELDVAAVDPLNSSATLVPNNRNQIVVDAFNGTRTVYLGFNTKRQPFSDKAVRQAVCQGIDRAEIAKVLFGGYAEVPLADISPGSWYYNAKVKSWPFDPTLARQSLTNAGYVLTNRGWCHQSEHAQYGVSEEGQPLSFRILTVKDFQDVAQVISDDLYQIKIPTEVQVLEYTTLRSKYLKSGDFDVFLWSRSSGPDPECSLIWGTKGPLNFVSFSDPAVDDLIEQGRRATAKQARRRIYGKIQEILAEQLPWVFLVQPKLLVAHKTSIENIKQASQQVTGLPWDNPLFNAPRWERRNRQ